MQLISWGIVLCIGRIHLSVFSFIYPFLKYDQFCLIIYWNQHGEFQETPYFPKLSSIFPWTIPKLCKLSHFSITNWKPKFPVLEVFLLNVPGMNFPAFDSRYNSAAIFFYGYWSCTNYCSEQNKRQCWLSNNSYGNAHYSHAHPWQLKNIHLY